MVWFHVYGKGDPGGSPLLGGDAVEKVGRLIISGPCTPVFNMACDEALGLCVNQPVLRFYLWEPPAVSLGYFQKTEEVIPLIADLGEVVLVRRITGGGAIYHYKELTYSIISAPEDIPLPAGVDESYRYLHAPFIHVLKQLGINADDNSPDEVTKTYVCFDSTTHYDVIADGKKIVGSAQRRHKKFFLQHGSIPLEQNPFSKKCTCVKEQIGKVVDPNQLMELLSKAISNHLAIDFKPSELTAEECRMIDTLKSKYVIDL